MHRTLAIGRMHVESRLFTLQNWLDEGLREGGHPCIDAARVTGWGERIREIRRRAQTIRKELKPSLEQDLGLKIRRSEHLLIAMFQPSTKNLFTEMRVQVERMGGAPLSADEIASLSELPEIAKVFAWIGDAALNLAVLYEIWSPGIPHVGDLTDRRRSCVENANLALLADRWGLYEYRIHFDPPKDALMTDRETLRRVKGTLAESIAGILFMQGGLRAVSRMIPLIRPPHDSGS